jgi:DNA-binding NarL/FixJ family response regulator
MAAKEANTIQVLLADDDVGFLETLQTLIEHEQGLAVVGTATDGLEAIELVDELEPHAAVVDLHMPLLDGVSAVARLRRDHPGICLIAVTGDRAPELHLTHIRISCDIGTRLSSTSRPTAT